MDFFLWGYLKSRVYTDVPFPDIATLRQKIDDECARVPLPMIRNSIQDYRVRLLVCLERAGRSVETR